MNRQWRFFRYIPKRKILWRCYFTAKRQVLSKIPIIIKPVSRNVNSAQFKSDLLYSANLLPGQRIKKTATNTFQFTFLNERQEITFPVTWQQQDIKHVSHLWLFNLHYMEYLPELDYQDAIKLIRSWIEENPIYQKHYWRAAWSAYTLSIRTVMWVDFILRYKGVLSSHDAQVILASLSQQIKFLAKNLEFDIGGNHLIKNIKALIIVGSFLRETNLLQCGEKLLKQQVETQVLADGMHFELSPAYHCQVFMDIIECYPFVTTALQTVLQDKLARMLQVIVDFTHPDNLISLFNDGGLHMSYLPTQCVDVYQKLFAKSVKPQQGAFAYHNAGYWGFRHEDMLFIADCGKVGPDELVAHAHGDILSFELSVAGKRIFVDPGTCEYASGNKRQYSRATASHNTLTIDNEDQAEFFGAFRVGRRPIPEILESVIDKNILSLKGQHDGYMHLSGKPVHQRCFMVSNDSIEITDSVYGGDGQIAESLFLLHPDCTVELLPNVCKVMNAGIVIELHSQQSMQIIDKYWSPDFGYFQSTKAILIDIGTIPCQVIIKLLLKY